MGTGRSRRSATDRRGVVAVGVERRVQVDEVDRSAVTAAQDVQIVPGPDGSVGKIGHSFDPQTESSDGRLHSQVCHY